MPYADMLTLDQIRVLQAIVDTGTFSGAAHELGRSQGAISYQVAAMEDTLEFQLFDRSSRRPKLTAAGRAIATEAPSLLARIDHLRGVARGLRDGLEPRLSIAVDTLFPMA
ncbi:MAG: LysR family transcriptional regulator, partial [Myxococcota bacterium]